MHNTPSEWNKLKKIASLVQRHNPQTIVPLGDDGYVFKNFPGLSVIAQDMMIENVHFNMDYTTAKDLGFKALAVNLSDLAAMGANGHFAQVSLGIPKNLTDSWLDDFYTGMTSLADQFDVEIVGGDLCVSPTAIVVDVSVYGSCKTPLTRSNVQTNDLLLSSGPLGLSTVGLWALKSGNQMNFPSAIKRHLTPSPRLDLVEQLQKNHHLIHGLMDCSDGLVNDGLQLTRHTLGLDIFTDQIQFHSEIKLQTQIPPIETVLWGGEDYELLLAVSPNAVDNFPNWNILGQFTDNPGIYLKTETSKVKITEFKGWKHF